MYKIKHARRDEQTGIIYHDTGTYPLAYRAIRAGLAWPYKNAPGYFLLLGQETHKNARGHYPLLFLLEAQYDALHGLLEALSDACAMVVCDEVFTDMAGNRECFEDAFHDHHRQEGTSLYLRQAPWVENFEYGLSLVERHIAHRSLYIPQDSTLARQLGEIPRGDPGEDPEAQFYAVNALRYVVAGFQKYGVHKPMTAQEARQLYQQYRPPRGI
ncbi:hypothetical protein ACFL0Q_04940 [Thermodesulfobacteriota bacterium]